jgi:uncharacterized membrane protein YciS (DUF1049 family)
MLAGSYTFGIIMFIAGLLVGCLTCGSYIFIKKRIEIAIKKKQMNAIRPGAQGIETIGNLEPVSVISSPLPTDVRSR